MGKGWIITIVCIVIFIALWVIMYFLGKKMQKKQEENQAQLEAAAQPASLLIIDKKKMKMKDANLPKVVMEQVPKRLRGSKMPIVKAKIGPQIVSLICDETIFDDLPVKREVKGMISGIYLISVKNIRGGAVPQEDKKKPSLRARLLKKQKQLQAELKEEQAASEANKAAKSKKKKK